MAIYKAHINKEFLTLSNKTAQDSRLSFEARGVLVLLLSMPSDWSVNIAWIQKQSNAGRDKVSRIISELVDCGYMRKDQPRSQKGAFTSQDYFVYADSPLNTTANGFAVNGLAVTGKTPTTKETVIQKKQTTNVYVEQARLCLEYLNKVTSSKYRSDTKSHIANITARLNDGFTVEQIKRVVDCKFIEWGSDAKMSQYLRPQTLFSTGKFQGYLNCSKVGKAINHKNPIQGTDYFDNQEL